MVEHLISFVLAIWAATIACPAQSNAPPRIGGWGPSQCGVRLGIYYMPNVLKPGGHAKLFTCLWNTSSNVVLVQLLHSSGSNTITNEAGKAYQLTPWYYNPGSGLLKFYPVLEPGEIRLLSAVDMVAEGVPPGDYEYAGDTLRFRIMSASGLKPGREVVPGVANFAEATNSFAILSNVVCMVKSNPLKLRIMRALDSTALPPEIITNAPLGAGAGPGPAAARGF